MPKRDQAPIGAPCWVDLMTSDTDKARAFYGEVFGWDSDDGDPEFGGYFSFTKDGAPIAGCMGKQPEQADLPDIWTVYLAVENAAATVDAAAAQGAQVHAPAMDVGDLGTMAILADVGGAGVGLWQPKAHPGFTELGEPNTPSWFELHTRDYEKSVAFYRDVFKWEPQTQGDTPEFRYTTNGDYAGGTATAGIMDATAFLPDGVPAMWSVYFGVDDADKTLAQIVDLGGSVVLPAEDTPYGRLAQAADPSGALFKLVAG